MTYFLIEAALFVALVITAWRVTKMHRELKRLRRHEAEFAQMSGQMSAAFDNISAAVHDLNANGMRLVHLLGRKIDEAGELLAELDRRRDERSLRAVEIGERSLGERSYAPLATVGKSNR
jgi:hypothetical protein